jgi:hypothetical protein
MYHLSHTPKHALTIGCAATLGQQTTTVTNFMESSNRVDSMSVASVTSAQEILSEQPASHR